MQLRCFLGARCLICSENSGRVGFVGNNLKRHGAVEGKTEAINQQRRRVRALLVGHCGEDARNRAKGVHGQSNQ